MHRLLFSQRVSYKEAFKKRETSLYAQDRIVKILFSTIPTTSWFDWSLSHNPLEMVTFIYIYIKIKDFFNFQSLAL